MSSRFKKLLTKQFDQSDCGIACLSMVIKYYGGKKSIEYLRNISGTSKEGTSLLGLSHAAEQCGLIPEALATNINTLIIYNKPAILHVLVDGYLQHFIVFLKYEDNKLIIANPSKGIEKYTVEKLNSIWKSKALLKFTPNENFEKVETIKKEKLVWFKQLLKDDLGLLGIIFFLSLVISILGMAMAIYAQKLIDEILPQKDTDKIIMGTVLLLILLMARAGLSYLAGFFGFQQGRDYNNRLINRFFGSLLYLPKSFFDSRRIGELVARMNDTSRIQNTITQVVGELLKNFLFVIVGLIVLFIYSKTIGIIVLASIPFFVFISYRYHKPIVTSQQNVMAANAHKSSNYVNTMQGIDSVKAYNKEPTFAQLNKNIYEHFQDTIFNLGKLGISLQMAAEFLGVITTVAVLAVGSLLVVDEKITTGALMAIITISGSVFPGITSLAFANITLQGAKVAFDRMFEFTSIKPEYMDSNDIPKNKIEFEQLNVKDISFRFPGRKQILKSVNISLKKGQSIAILGESGGGKSTLLNLLQGFYTAESGKIELNGKELKNYDISWLRKSIGVVPQEVSIFNGTLLDNLLLGGNENETKHCLQFCQQNGFDNYFSKFPQGYGTILGEEGINISGGQKQLIGMCRALLHQPSLLLLDEPTSAMDRVTENVMLGLLNQYKPQCGIILITHQLKIANHTDYIYILKNGEIQASGDQKELLKRDNLYSQLYKEILVDTTLS